MLAWPQPLAEWETEHLAKSKEHSSGRTQPLLTPVNVLVIPVLRWFSSFRLKSTENSALVSPLFLQTKNMKHRSLASIATPTLEGSYKHRELKYKVWLRSFTVFVGTRIVSIQ